MSERERTIMSVTWLAHLTLSEEGMKVDTGIGEKDKKRKKVTKIDKEIDEDR